MKTDEGRAQLLASIMVVAIGLFNMPYGYCVFLKIVLRTVLLRQAFIQSKGALRAKIFWRICTLLERVSQRTTRQQLSGTPKPLSKDVPMLNICRVKRTMLV